MLSYPSTQTIYKWVHLSCAYWIPGTIVTPKTPVRLAKFEDRRFTLQCIICLKTAENSGACMQCQFSKCNIAFHVECARRASYFMEIEKKEGSRDKTYKIFCEKHRPLKIVKEIAERDRQTIEEIQKFCKIIDKCMEIEARYQAKPRR
jgi:bromodomain and PHD finger-containing protein 1